MQTVTNIPQDYALTRYFAKYYSLHSVKSLPSEKRHAENIARASGFPFREIKLNIHGNKEWNEHPMKNLLILSLLIDEGLKFGFVRNSPAYVQKCMSAKAQFDIKYKEKGFKPAADRRFNRWGGRDTAEVQVLVDRVGYYIGTLEYDKKTCKWYTRDHFGSHHYPTREAAEAVCERFKQLYRI